MYMCGGVPGVCALGYMEVYMLWCRYMCFLFVCHGNGEWVASLLLMVVVMKMGSYNFVQLGYYVHVLSPVRSLELICQCYTSCVLPVNPDVSMMKP